MPTGPPFAVAASPAVVVWVFASSGWGKASRAAAVLRHLPGAEAWSAWGPAGPGPLEQAGVAHRRLPEAAALLDAADEPAVLVVDVPGSWTADAGLAGLVARRRGRGLATVAAAPHSTWPVPALVWTCVLVCDPLLAGRPPLPPVPQVDAWPLLAAPPLPHGVARRRWADRADRRPVVLLVDPVFDRGRSRALLGRPDPAWNVVQAEGAGLGRWLAGADVVVGPAGGRLVDECRAAGVRHVAYPHPAAGDQAARANVPWGPLAGPVAAALAGPRPAPAGEDRSAAVARMLASLG